jgi:hypothetical protein
MEYLRMAAAAVDAVASGDEGEGDDDYGDNWAIFEEDEERAEADDRWGTTTSWSGII